MRKVCVVTGSRADYGLLRWVIQGIEDSSSLELILIATGMHLSPEFGLTWREIEDDGFRIDRKIETLLSADTPTAIAKSMGLGMIGFAEAYANLEPDLVLVLGDRYEIFSAAACAMVARIPIAHVHGGEATEGLIDEAIRHSITKMAHFHFAAAEPYRRRILQLGEAPERVFNVGGLGLDGILNFDLLDRAELERDLGIEFGIRNLMVTFHPVTLERDSATSQMAALLSALEQLADTCLIFTMPNADTEGRALIGMVQEFVARHPNAHAFTTLGHLRYLSCLRYVDGVVGNSSSGITEVPSFSKGTINIGDRQRGRVKASSVIDCAADTESVIIALQRLYSNQFQLTLSSVENPYGLGGASQAIVRIIESVPLEGVVLKSFVDLESV